VILDLFYICYKPSLPLQKTLLLLLPKKTYYYLNQYCQIIKNTAAECLPILISKKLLKVHVKKKFDNNEMA